MADEEGTKLGEELRDGAFAAMKERDGGWFDEAVDLLPVAMAHLAPFRSFQFSELADALFFVGLREPDTFSPDKYWGPLAKEAVRLRLIKPRGEWEKSRCLTRKASLCRAFVKGELGWWE